MRRDGRTGQLLVLYDADCGICTATADRLRRWDRRGRLELLALQSATADARQLVRDVAAGHPLHDELHVIDPTTGVVRSGGAAFVEIVGRLPGGRLPSLIGGLPPIAWLIGIGYGLVARNRRAISRALRFETACRVRAG
jgi:predicted DCC family thiol-disulfide oxidoreductase YuxK